MSTDTEVAMLRTTVRELFVQLEQVSGHIAMRDEVLLSPREVLDYAATSGRSRRTPQEDEPRRRWVIIPAFANEETHRAAWAVLERWRSLARALAANVLCPAEEQEDTQVRTCAMCDTYPIRSATWFCRFEQLATDAHRETGRREALHAWHGGVCLECLDAAMANSLLTWLQVVDLSGVQWVRTPNGEFEYQVDPAKVRFQIGNRTLSERVLAVIRAAHPKRNLVTDQEISDRLAVLRVLETGKGKQTTEGGAV